MATCVSCFRQVPDEADHCVHCGASRSRIRSHRPTVEGPGARPGTDRGVPSVARISPGSLPPHRRDTEVSAADGVQGPAMAVVSADPPLPGQVATETPVVAPVAPANDLAPVPVKPAEQVPAPSASPPAATSKPVLASESLAAEAHPVEPGRRLMRWVMGSAGGLLLLLSLLAWSLQSQLQHAGLSSSERAYAGAAAVLLVGGALLRLPYTVRAVLALASGLGAVGLALVAWSWNEGVTALAIFVLAAGLFHRWRFRASRRARGLVALGAITLLATLLIPRAGVVPLVDVLARLAVAEGAAALLTLALPLLLMLLALLSLLAFLGSDSTGLASLWACALVGYLPLKLWIASGLSGWIQGSGLLALLAVGCLGAAQVLATVAPPRLPE